MSADTLFIFGLGGHAKVILSEALLSDNYGNIIFISEKNFTDDHISFDNISYKVINSLDVLKDLYNDSSTGIVGIGEIKTRVKIVREVKRIIPSFRWAKIISSNATISNDVEINEGTIVVAGSIINTGTVIGKHSIINTRATIDHDNTIKDFVNISPTVVTGGTVMINDECDIGIGTIIKNNITINKNVVIGGNSFVNKNCESNFLYFGSPIKKVKKI
jgi:sugar O-acyltransferase (sialic acid O-acetyltransferase NeuD family)